MEKYQNALN